MDDTNIKIEYRDTPEKFRTAADEVISWLADVNWKHSKEDKWARGWV